MYIGVFSAEHDYDNHQASYLRDLLKSEGVRAKLGPSCYVAHRCIEVHALDLLLASKALIKNSPTRDHLNRFIARCCREKASDYSDTIRRLRRELKEKQERAKAQARKSKRKAS